MMCNSFGRYHFPEQKLIIIGNRGGLNREAIEKDHAGAGPVLAGNRRFNPPLRSLWACYIEFNLCPVRSSGPQQNDMHEHGPTQRITAASAGVIGQT